ncbi:hypothetical protein [Laceyella sacchari]|uniref:Uncharacterized protein n=1 Tax=Laceyella sacchari TaxID=37482 RepID=A0ABY5TZU4_LACSH|nr:hypothetical protein [Laceyella sacchari]UWE02931.1 hypothetical protein NYR52_12440 [Laceyella sacchari]
MNFKELDQMVGWEQEVDNIDWKSMLEDIDRALMDNLAAELGFRTYEQLEHASERIVQDYYIVYLSDGRYAWWNPLKYATEDPLYFADKEEIEQYITGLLRLDNEQRAQLRSGLARIPQMHRCIVCEYEFNPKDPERRKWDSSEERNEFCSAECAMEHVMTEMKEDFTG